MNNGDRQSLSMIINYDKKLIKKFRKLTEKVLHSDINHNKKQEYLEQFRDGVNGTKFNALCPIPGYPEIIEDISNSNSKDENNSNSNFNYNNYNNDYSNNSSNSNSNSNNNNNNNNNGNYNLNKHISTISINENDRDDSSISQSLLPSPKFYNTSFFSEKEDYSTYKTLTANSINDDTLVESNRIFLKNKQIEAKFKENKKEKIVNKLEEIKTNLIEIECPNCSYLNHPIMIKCEVCNAQLIQLSSSSSSLSSSSIIYEENQSIQSETINYELLKTRLTILSINDPDYIKFRNTLISEIPKSNVKGVIKIDMPTKLLKNHEKYKKNISKKTGLPLEKITHQVFHGTTTRFGCNPERFLVNHNFYNENYDCKFCKKGCGMCGILQYGNKKQLSKHSKKMWFAHSTLVSRHYTGFNSIKVMFVVEVVSKDNNWILVVRKNKATLPKFMIIFEQ